MKFRAKLELNGKTATGISVPDEIVDALAAGGRPAVTVTLNRYSFATTLGAMGGVAKIPVSAEHREQAGIAAGDDVAVEIIVDTAVREVAVPSDLAVALANDRNAAAAFEKLSNSRKKQLTLPIAAANTPETRKRRIDKALASLAKTG